MRRLPLVLLVLVAAAMLSRAAFADRASVGLLTLEGPPGTQRALDALAVQAANILPQLESDLGARFGARFRIVLIPTGGPRDSALSRLDASAPPWASGFMIPAQRIGAIREAEATRYPFGTLESVLAHEATHMLLHDAVSDRLPLWFEEGVATWQDRKWALADAVVYSSALLTNDLPRLAALDSSFHASEGEARLAYAASFAFVARAVRRHGRPFLIRVLRGARQGSFDSAWLAAAGVSLADEETRWRRDSLIRYRWFPILTASSTLWIGLSLLTVAAGFRKRRQARRMRERWGAEEDANEDVEGDVETRTLAQDDAGDPEADPTREGPQGSDPAGS